MLPCLQAETLERELQLQLRECALELQKLRNQVGAGARRLAGVQRKLAALRP